MVVKCFHICEMVLRTLQRKSYCGSLLAFLTQHKTFRSCDKTFYNVWNAASARSIISHPAELFTAGLERPRTVRLQKPESVLNCAHRAQSGRGGSKRSFVLSGVCQLQNEPTSRHRPFKPQLWPNIRQKFLKTLEPAKLLSAFDNFRLNTWAFQGQASPWTGALARRSSSRWRRQGWGETWGEGRATWRQATGRLRPATAAGSWNKKICKKAGFREILEYIINTNWKLMLGKEKAT